MSIQTPPDADRPSPAEEEAPSAAPPPDSGRSTIADIATGASRRWALTVALLVAVLASGLYAFFVGLDRQGFPPVDTPISFVTGAYFVGDPEQVDADVAAPLEEVLGEVDGVSSTTTQSQPNTFAVIVEFEDGVSSEEGTERLIAAGAEVPDAAQVEYRSVSAASFVGEYDLLVSLVGPDGVSPEDLQARAEGLADALASIDAVDAAEVRDLISEVVDPATGEQVERLTRYTRVALDDAGYQAAIAVGLTQAEDSDLDVLEFSNAVQAQLDDTALDEGYEAAITADFAISVRQQLDSLSSNLRTGLIAVALVSLLLIGWRAAVMTAGFMATVMIAALALLWSIGFSLNTITLFGLILTLGLLVDDAIVISESIDANREEPDPREDDERLGVIRTALARVGSASLAGTLTTVVVFSPLLFVSGIIGEFVSPIPTTVIMTLLASFLFSILFIPVAARAFLLRGTAGRNPIVLALRAMAKAAGRLAAYPSGNGWKGWLVGLGLAGFAFIAIGAGGALAGNLGFSIFPTGKDSVGLTINAEFPPGTTIEQSQTIADQIDGVVVDTLGAELVRSQYVRGNERVIETFIDLTPIGSRETTAPEYVAEIEEGIADIQGARITVAQTENGPPLEEFPFAAQIEVTSETAEAGQELVQDIRDDLVGTEFAVGEETVTITDAIVSTDGQVFRADGERYVEVRAAYDDPSSLTALVTDTQELVEDRFGSELADRGLPQEALGFDFGLESDNQEDFAGLALAGQIALVLMLVLIAAQFRSIAQSLLIFLAIPFSFLGVFSLLTITDNPLSFLVTVGFIALIGVAVNNTILLVEAANRARRGGATAGEAIREAVERRFRPLIATTITTVVGLLPLSLSDPFWESLGFTLIGGLISSTLLVLVSFPVFYLALEAMRTPVRNWWRRKRGRPLLT
ncbi:efflux RND transporter permease subunit [Euzebya tangerina]|uniref:efflux RND transporter permease subunit n=1 Tax=Euzebya tangerina TaxID=591198 RepID=UPI000E3232FD|nr:efflux RND transporter permease subunit [Euzebya tangerina]